MFVLKRLVGLKRGPRRGLVAVLNMKGFAIAFCLFFFLFPLPASCRGQIVHPFLAMAKKKKKQQSGKDGDNHEENWKLNLPALEGGEAVAGKGRFLEKKDPRSAQRDTFLVLGPPLDFSINWRLGNQKTKREKKEGPGFGRWGGSETTRTHT